jgi:hypothetical protein
LLNFLTFGRNVNLLLVATTGAILRLFLTLACGASSV